MIEVYMLGVIVSVVKLGQLASVTPGIGFFAFGWLILISAASYAAFDPDEFWEAVERLR
jgi:paraquat-inducible protein A